MIKIVYKKGLNEGVIDGLDRVRRQGNEGTGEHVTCCRRQGNR